MIKGLLILIILSSAQAGCAPNVNNVDALPHYLGDGCKQAYAMFLGSDEPRAFAISRNGKCGFASGLIHTDAGVGSEAVKVCEALNGTNCFIYALNHSVVGTNHN